MTEVTVTTSKCGFVTNNDKWDPLEISFNEWHNKAGLIFTIKSRFASQRTISLSEQELTMIAKILAATKTIDLLEIYENYSS